SPDRMSPCFHSACARFALLPSVFSIELVRFASPTHLTRFVSNLDPPLGSRRLEDSPSTPGWGTYADTVHEARDIDVPIYLSIEPDLGEPLPLVSQQVQRLRRRQVDGSIGCRQVGWLVKSHATSSNGNDHACQRRHALARPQSEQYRGP